MQNKLSFRSVILRNEFKAIKGKYNSTIVYLFIILFIAFLAFGFAKSTLTYQQELSADPFSNWINLNYHSATGDSLRVLNDRIRDKQFRDRFHIKGSYFYNKGMVSVLAVSHGNTTRPFEARTIDPRSGIGKDLMKSGVCRKFFPDTVDNAFSFDPNGVIISRRLLDYTGLNQETMSFIQVKTMAGDIIPVPVLAVVEELPDLADIVYTNLFYCKSMNTGFYDREHLGYRFFIENMDTADVLKTLHELYTVFEIKDPATVQTSALETGNRSVLNWKIEIEGQKQIDSFSKMNEIIATMVSLKNHHVGQYFELSDDTACDNSSFFHDYLAIEFADMENIRNFSRYLHEKLELQLNLEVLAERENYLYTGNIAIGSILLLMVLALLSVSIYLSGIIRNHLLMIKKNLGNFLAFGVKNATLTWLYILVTIKILVFALFPALILALVCGELFEKHLLGKFLVLDPEKNYFSLTNAWFALFLVLIFFVAILRTYISVNKILKQTPGNIIYERNS
jgi:hypothetical protein